MKEVTHDHLPRHHYDRAGDDRHRARSKEAPGQLTRSASTTTTTRRGEDGQDVSPVVALMF